MHTYVQKLPPQRLAQRHILSDLQPSSDCSRFVTNAEADTQTWTCQMNPHRRTDRSHKEMRVLETFTDWASQYRPPCNLNTPTRDIPRVQYTHAHAVTGLPSHMGARAHARTQTRLQNKEHETKLTSCSFLWLTVGFTMHART